MNIVLQHKFYTLCPDKHALFAGMFSKNTGSLNPNSCTVASYMREVIKQANSPLNSLPGEMFRWNPNNYVGDGFEIFVEALIKLMGLHPDIGVTEYVPQPGKDNGVDGVGKGILDLRTVTVQAKYRPHEDALLSGGKDRLDSFWAESTGVRFKVKLDWDENNKLIGQKPMLVITAAAGINQYTKEDKYDGVMRCLGSKWLNNNINGNTAFWKQFYELMM